MKCENFAYWLQGFFEISEASSNREAEGLTTGQVEMIKKHLALVFIHDIDPKAGGPEHQKQLNEAHFGKPKIGGIGPGGLIARC